MDTTEIRLSAEGLHVGGSRRIMCPVCQGGSSHERTCVITREATGVLYNCHRGSCVYFGFLPTAGALVEAQAKPTPQRPYEGALHGLTEEDLAFFRERYEITPPLGWYRNDYDEYVLSIHNPLGYTRGYNVRQPWPGAPIKGRPDKPKTRVWMHAAGPVQSFHTHGVAGDVIVLVEDQLSAEKVRQAGIGAVALMGTHLNADKVREIAMLRPKEVIIALDADATGLAFKHAREWGMAFNKTRVAVLERDLKDCNMDEISIILGVER